MNAYCKDKISITERKDEMRDWQYKNSSKG